MVRKILFLIFIISACKTSPQSDSVPGAEFISLHISETGGFTNGFPERIIRPSGQVFELNGSLLSTLDSAALEKLEQQVIALKSLSAYQGELSTLNRELKLITRKGNSFYAWSVEDPQAEELNHIFRQLNALINQ